MNALLEWCMINIASVLQVRFDTEEVMMLFSRLLSNISFGYVSEQI